MIKVDVTYVGGDVAHMDVEDWDISGNQEVLMFKHSETVTEIVPLCNVISVVVSEPLEGDGDE